MMSEAVMSEAVTLWHGVVVSEAVTLYVAW